MAGGGRPRPEIGSGKAARRRWPPSGWRVRCSLMPAAMLEIHDAALRVLWGLLEANPLRRCARRRRWAPSTIDYTHHDQKKDRARKPPATLAPSHPKPLHAGNSQEPGLWGSCQPAERHSSAPATPAPSHPKPLHAGNCLAPAEGGVGGGEGPPDSSSQPAFLGPHTTSQQQAQQKAIRESGFVPGQARSGMHQKRG